MSVNPASIPTFNYIGTPYRQSLNLNTLSKQPAMVPVTIDWLVYGISTDTPNIGVNVNLSGSQGGTISILDAIKAVFIDNTNVSFPVSVYFADTGTTVTCEPFSVGLFPVFTNNLQAVIYASGGFDGANLETKVFFLNTFISPYTSAQQNFTYPLYKSTPNDRKQFPPSPGGDNSSYSQMAVADQIGNWTRTALAQAPFIMWAFGSGFIYLKALRANGTGLFTNGGVTYSLFQISDDLGNNIVQQYVGSGFYYPSSFVGKPNWTGVEQAYTTTEGGNNYNTQQHNITYEGDNDLFQQSFFPLNTEICNFQDLNLRLDGSRIWSCSVINPIPPGGNGVYNVMAAWAWNPT